MRRSVRVTGCSWPARSPRPASVTSIAWWRERCGDALGLERLAACVERRRERRLRRVDGFARGGNLLGRQLADLAQLRREHALLAEVLHAHGLERGQVAAAVTAASACSSS